MILTIFLFGQDSEYNEIKNSYLKSYDYEKVGRYKEAIKVLAPLYQKYPKGYTLNLRFGWLFFLNKNYNNSIKYYEKASLLKPYSQEPKLGLMRVYLATYQYSSAEEVGNKILKIDFYNYFGNYYLVKALIFQKKYKLAQNLINKMLNIYPTDVKFLQELALIYKKTNSKYLKKVYEDILILDPNNIFVRKQ